MIQTTKTQAHIQSFTVNGDRPKNQGRPIVVRAPLFMKCFRATIVVNNYGSNMGQELFISTSPTNQEENCVYLSTQFFIDTQLPPDVDIGRNAINQLVLDRRGIGYMVDEFYFYSVACAVTIIWEGIRE